jgi:probable addiction module antidote protein
LGFVSKKDPAMKKASVSYRKHLLKDLADPKFAAAYINAALEEDSQEAILLALRDVAEARGMQAIARYSKLNRESMYRMLSKRGNPQLSSLTRLLKSLGLSLSVQAHRHAKAA